MAWVLYLPFVSSKQHQPTNTMTADTITVPKLLDLLAKLRDSADNIALLIREVERGDINTKDAATIVNNAVAAIKTLSK